MKTVMTTSILLGGLALLTAGSLFAGDEGWTDDFEAAKAQARAEGKDLLMDFTGSDWCGWCIKLSKEVFDQEAFKDVIHEDFILVKVDFPRDQSLVTDEVRAQNELLKQQYSIQGYPTIFLTDAEGRPYAQTGYQKGGPENYLAHLGEFKRDRTERDELLLRAAEKTGLDRARLLDQALEKTEPALIMSFYAEQVDAVIALDADNAAGLKQKYSALLEQHRIQKVCQGMEQDFQNHAKDGRWDEVIALLEQAASAHSGSTTVAHHSHFFRAIAFYYKGELDQALAALEKSTEAEPDGELTRQIPGLRKAIEERRAANENGDGN